ncbi:MAG TPA: penicillin-binding protein 1C [Elusimicrobia bacterium]|nr:penicillin-binding protein 1C [Elusimicrobiota bacterium]
MRIARAACLLSLLALPASAAPAPGASTGITDRYGRELRAYLDGASASACVPVKLEGISPWLVLATVAAEDKRFFSHSGVDLRSVARAVWQNSKNGRTVSGASTITQQLARALKPRPRTFLGKLSEMFSALRLEAGHSKEEILEGYFNGVSYGPLLTGAEAAAKAYFGLPARDLSLAQAALLAGIPKSPVNYDPQKHPKEAFARQGLILRRMLDAGLVDGENYRLAAAEKVSINKKESVFAAPHFADQVLRRSGRGQVTSTLDLRVQERAADALKNHLEELSARNHVTNGAVLVLENATGAVLAWVGSNDFFDAAHSGQVDGVVARRQPGSALKPFLYALALFKGAKASDLIEDEPFFAAGGHSAMNYDKTYHGKVRLREALACSYNVPAVRLAQKTGVSAFLAKLRDFGFASLDKPAAFYGEGLALGNGEVTLLELVNAYAALARGGIWLPARLAAGERADGARRVMGAREAYIITSILSDNSARAPAFGVNSAFNLPFDFAGKTGTTKDYRDNWAVGYTPEWTVGVWVGNFDGAPMRKVSGITGAAPVLREVALELNKLYPSAPFKRPPGVKTVRVCPVSGLPPSGYCPASMDEVFASASLPSGQCAEHLPPGDTAAPSPAAAGPSIKFPGDGDIFRIDPQTPRAAQALFFKASAGGDLVWSVDALELAERGQEVLWPLKPGKHSVYFTAVLNGQPYKSRPVRFTVIK